MDKFAHLWWLVYFFGVYSGFWVAAALLTKWERDQDRDR